jgi:hypothetical protein
MSDVHGTKPILKPLAFDYLKRAELMLRALKEVEQWQNILDLLY